MKGRAASFKDDLSSMSTVLHETVTAAPVCTACMKYWGKQSQVPSENASDLLISRGGRSSGGRRCVGSGRGTARPYLRGDIIRGPTEGVRPGISQHVLFAHPEVRYFDMSIFV